MAAFNFKEKQFDELIHNPYNEDPEETAVLTTIGKLSRAFAGLEKYNPERMRGNVAQYILYFYDKNTPLRSLFPDIAQRKQQAAVLAGFNLVDDEERVNRLYSLSDKPVTAAVVNFVQYQNSREWSLLVTNEQLLWETQENLMKKFSASDYKDPKQMLDAVKVKTQLSGETDKIMDLITKYEDRLFAGDDIARDAAANLRSTGMTPESFAFSMEHVP